MIRATDRPMFSGDTMNSCLEQYKQFILNKKTPKLGAERAAIYFENCVTMMYDSINDILIGKNTIITYTGDNSALIKLVDKGNSLPQEHELKYNAMVALANQGGVNLVYEATIIDGEGIVEFAALAKVGERVWIPNRQLKSTYIPKLEEIGDVTPINDDELAQVGKSIAFNKTFFNARPLAV